MRSLASILLLSLLLPGLAAAQSPAGGLLGLEDPLKNPPSLAEVNATLASLKQEGRTQDAQLVSTLRPIALASEGQDEAALAEAKTAVELAQRLNRPRRAYEVSLVAARAAHRLKHADAAIPHYRAAYDSAWQALLAAAFGHDRVQMPEFAGDRMIVKEVQVPAGNDRLLALMQEGARAMDALDRPAEVVRWLNDCAEKWTSAVAMILGSEETKILKELSTKASQEGRLKAQQIYAAELAVRSAAQDERAAEWSAGRDEIRGYLLWAYAALGLLTLAFAVFLIQGEVRESQRVRNHPPKRYDDILLTSAKVTRRGPAEIPLAWETSKADVVSKSFMTVFFLACAIGCLVGAWAFLSLSWDKAAPGKFGTPALTVGLSALFLWFATYVVFGLLIGRSTVVRRAVEIEDKTLIVRTRPGVFGSEVFEERFTAEMIQRVLLVVGEQRVPQGPSLAVYQAAVEVPPAEGDSRGRIIVLGGRHKQENLVPYLASLTHLTGGSFEVMAAGANNV